jgi:hypothetical protein
MRKEPQLGFCEGFIFEFETRLYPHRASGNLDRWLAISSSQSIQFVKTAHPRTRHLACSISPSTKGEHRSRRGCSSAAANWWWRWWRRPRHPHARCSVRVTATVSGRPSDAGASLKLRATLRATRYPDGECRHLAIRSLKWLKPKQPVLLPAINDPSHVEFLTSRQSWRGHQ